MSRLHLQCVGYCGPGIHASAQRHPDGTFTYNGELLMSATDPENGTVTYTYNRYNKAATKTDAKGQVFLMFTIF